MKTATRDWIALVEASYDLDASPQDWLEALLRHIVPLVDRPGAPVSVFTCR